MEGFTKKDRPLTDRFFSAFEAAKDKDPNGWSQRMESERFQRFTVPLELATDAIHNLGAVILDSKEIVKRLEA